MTAQELAAQLLYGKKRYFLHSHLSGPERRICEHHPDIPGEIIVLSEYKTLDEALAIMKPLEIAHAARQILEFSEHWAANTNGLNTIKEAS